MLLSWKSPYHVNKDNVDNIIGFQSTEVRRIYEVHLITSTWWMSAGLRSRNERITYYHRLVAGALLVLKQATGD